MKREAFRQPAQARRELRTALPAPRLSRLARI
jgi:hypothetical protein